MAATHYWCRLWYPAAPGERPCDSFLEAGSYTRHAGADGREVELPVEDPTFVSCDVHEAEEIDEVNATEFERRLASAHRLATARGYAIPEPEPWDGADLFTGREVADPRPGFCCGPGEARYERCGAVLVELECDTPAGVRRKRICRLLLSLAARTGPWAGEDLSAAIRAGHVNDSLPHLPPNY